MEQNTASGNQAENKPKSPKFVRWAVMIGIAVALNLFILVSRTLVLTVPNSQDYCPAPTASSTPQTEQACAAQNGIWNDLSDPSVKSPSTTTPAGYCDLTAQCMPKYQAAYTQYEMWSFIIMIGLGVLAIIVSVLPIGSSIVSAGLAYGGVLAFIVGGAQYWSDASSWLRLAMSIIALGALIYIGIKRFHD